jgi:hypothetical protein
MAFKMRPGSGAQHPEDEEMQRMSVPAQASTLQTGGENAKRALGKTPKTSELHPLNPGGNQPPPDILELDVTVQDVEMRRAHGNNATEEARRAKMFAAHHEGSSSGSIKGSETPDDRIGKERRETRIPIQFVVDRLQLKLESGDLYLDMVIFVPFLIMFVFFILLNHAVEENFYVMEGMREQYEDTEFPRNNFKVDMFRNEMANGLRLWVELDKHYFDMGNQGDWGSWLMDTVIASTWNNLPKNNSHSSLLPIRATRGQSLLIGAMRFRTIRMRHRSCPVFSDIYPINTSHAYFPHVCYEVGFGSSGEETEGFCQTIYDPRLSYNAPLYVYYPSGSVPGAPIIGQYGVYHSGGWIFQLAFNDTYTDVFNVGGVVTPNFCSFADNWANRFTITEFFIYTPHTDYFHAIKYFTEVDAAGWWNNEFYLKSFRVWSKRQMGTTVYNVFFFCYVVYYIVMYFLGVVNAAHSKELLKYLTEFWNFLEIASLAAFLVVFSFYFAWINRSVQSLPNLKFPFPPQYPPDLDALVTMVWTVNTANVFTIILTFLRLLKYVRLSSYFGVISRTLAVAQQSIAGVIVLFALVVVSFGLAGWSLWGINLYDYHEPAYAMSAAMRALVGQSLYHDMREINQYLALMYFWAFQILGFYLLLNFIIAILADSFALTSGRAFQQNVEELLVRSYQNMRAFLQPSNLKRIVRLALSGNSEPKLLRRVVAQLMDRKQNEERVVRELREARKLQQDGDAAAYDPAVDDDDDIVITMKLSDMAEFIDADTYALLTEHFFNYTWDEIMNEHDDAIKTNEAKDKRLMMHLVREAVLKVVENDIGKIDEVDEVLRTLEDEVHGMIQLLDNKSK